MKIQELFLKPIDRPIDGVIKADDQRNLRNELEEYVVTRDVMRGLGIFADRYLDELTANGVWISGFWGSGKSHLLKMLSHLLDQTPLPDGTMPADVLLPKVEDELVRAGLQKAARIPSRSLLFNIDQKFDGIGGDHQAPILEVFMKVLNELEGYYGKQGYVAKFERDLDVRGELASFKATYQRVNGTAWEVDREAVSTVRLASFGVAYAEQFGVREEEGRALISRLAEGYRVSIEDFAHLVKGYLDRQPPNFRLNFFVDEIGQFIGQDSKRMLNLQTVAETLGTVCAGRAWVFVTSQADLEGVLGDFKGMSSQDMSKIRGRFKTPMTLASADVREVIQKRLLAKTEAEPEVLTTIWDNEKDNLHTLYQFGDQSRSFTGWRGSDEFCSLYPFHPYQFGLFQEAIVQFSNHGAFTGRHTSVGERSMLEVFQDVAKVIRLDAVGRLATFDQMYDGIAASLRGNIQTTIKLAENQLGTGIPLRVLKALFLLKWVREFKATPRNVSILLIDRPDVDIRAHEKDVKAALELLASQSYLQRNGDAFEFLTDVEKDIEVEIKSTEVGESDVAELLAKILFTDVLREPKIRYEGNGQDYKYARKLDDALITREEDIALNVITADHPNSGDLTVLASQNMGRNDLLVVLPPEPRLIELAWHYLKTDKYVRQNAGGTDTTRAAILDQRSLQNAQRKSEILTLAGDLLGRAPMYLNGTILEAVGPGESRGRTARAFQELIAFAYPNLKMLRGSYDEASLSKALLESDDLLAGGAQPLSEPETEVFTQVRRVKANGERMTVEELVRHFEGRPYGWYPMATLTLVARLFRMGKIELRNPGLLDARGAHEELRSSRRLGGVRVGVQEQFDGTKVAALKAFHHDLFDRANEGTEARSVGEGLAAACRQKAGELQGLITQGTRYPFLQALKPVAEKLASLGEKDHAYLLNHLDEYRAELIDAKQALVAPVESFMHGPQRTVYDEVMAFYREEAANFAELPAEELQPLHTLADSAMPYQGGVIPPAKAAVARLRGLLAEMLPAERTAALAKVDQYEARISAHSDFAKLDPQEQARVMELSASARADIGTARFVPGVRDRVQRYLDREYQEQLAMLTRLSEAAGKPIPEGDDAPPVPTVQYVPASSLRPDCDLPYITTTGELETWIYALRTAAQAELAKGKRISL